MLVTPAILTLVLSSLAITPAASASPFPSPSPTTPPPAWPYNLVAFPKCIEPANSANNAIKVYEARRDWGRVISASITAAKKQTECADKITNNRSEQYVLRMTAATNYSRAADLAVQEKKYSMVPDIVARSNRIYHLMTAHPNSALEPEQSEFIAANIIANNDLLAQIPSSATRVARKPAAGQGANAVFVARPEARNTIHVGDTIIFPLYDSQGSLELYAGPLRRLGVRTIARHDLWQDTHYRSFNGSTRASPNIYDAASDRGEAFLAVGPGMVSGNILLSLPKNPEHCVSCRTVHYFVTVLPKR